MALTRGQLLRVGLWCGVAGLVVLLAYDVSGWLQAHFANRSVAAIAASPDPDPTGLDAPGEQFAFAWNAQRRGERELAATAYQLVIASPTTPEHLRVAAHYNLANLYLDRAIDYAMIPDVDRAHTETELAKIHYRAALRRQPGHWDARYNLETAHMLVPDLPEADLSNVPEDDDTPEDIWADFMQGRPQGLP